MSGSSRSWGVFCLPRRCRILSLCLFLRGKLPANSDVSVPLSKADFFKWVNKGLKIDLSADLTVEDVGKALGLWTDEEQQRKQLGADVFDPEGHQEAKSIDAAAETTGVTGGDKERK